MPVTPSGHLAVHLGSRRSGRAKPAGEPPLAERIPGRDGRLQCHPGSLLGTGCHLGHGRRRSGCLGVSRLRRGLTPDQRHEQFVRKSRSTAAAKMSSPCPHLSARHAARMAPAIACLTGGNRWAATRGCLATGPGRDTSRDTGADVSGCVPVSPGWRSATRLACSGRLSVSSGVPRCPPCPGRSSPPPTSTTPIWSRAAYVSPIWPGTAAGGPSSRAGSGCCPRRSW
jgi:hypothetical protein